MNRKIAWILMIPICIIALYFIGECYVCSRDNGDGGYRISFIYTNICNNLYR